MTDEPNPFFDEIVSAQVAVCFGISTSA